MKKIVSIFIATLILFISVSCLNFETTKEHKVPISNKVLNELKYPNLESFLIHTFEDSFLKKINLKHKSFLSNNEVTQLIDMNYATNPPQAFITYEIINPSNQKEMEDFLRDMEEYIIKRTNYFIASGNKF